MVERPAGQPLPPTPSRTASTGLELNQDLVRSLVDGTDLARTVVHPAQASIDQRIRVDNCSQVCATGSACAEPSTRAPQGEGLCFFTVNPERLPSPYSATFVRDVSTPLRIEASDFHNSTLRNINVQRGSRTLCDSFADRPRGAVRFDTGTYNPTRCGQEGADDCYELTVMVRVVGEPCVTGTCEQASELWGRRVRVHVAQPKTLAAHVADVEFLAAPVAAGLGRGSATAYFTPTVSGDGRMLVYDAAELGVAYSLIPASAAPCDLTQWTVARPLTQLYTDPAARDALGAPLYGLAAQPLRALDGSTLTSTSILSTGGYFWIDIHGSNLMFNLGSGEPPFYFNPAKGRIEHRVQVTALSGPGASLVDVATLERYSSPTFACNQSKMSADSCKAVGDFVDDALGAIFQSHHYGLGVVGAWTAGRVIKPDLRVQQTDLGIAMDHGLSAVLYADAVSRPVAAGDLHRKGSPANAFMHLAGARPRAPFDVTWLVSTDHDMDELVFDDFLDQDLLVSVPMNALDIGFRRSGNRASAGGFTTAPVFANNAASSRFAAPSVATLMGEGRAEPVALGGVSSTGLYLTGTNALVLQVPSEFSAAAGGAWFCSVWLDPRGEPAVGQDSAVVLETPNGSRIERLRGGRVRLSWPASRGSRGSRTFSSKLELRRYTHVSVAAEPSGSSTTLTLFINGYQAEPPVAVNVSAAFRMSAGRLGLGATAVGVGDGVAGWVDELKVYGRVPTREEICNQAWGTLVGLTQADTAVGASSIHATTRAELGALAGQYPTAYCDSRVVASRPRRAPSCIDRLHEQPRPEYCLREQVVFPQRRAASAPRPDVRNNRFCTSCHVPDHRVPGLDTEPALSPGVVAQFRDPVRRPMQPYMRLFGNIPASYGLVEVAGADYTDCSTTLGAGCSAP